MSYYGLTAQQLRNLPKQHGTVFFAIEDGKPVPCEPQEGAWFCEFDWDTDCEGEDFVRDGSLVRYAGREDAYHWSDAANAFVNSPRHVVEPECADGGTRTPSGALLIRQH